MRGAIAQILVLLVVALLPAIAAAVAHPRRPDWRGADHLALRTARGWGRQVLFVDARPPEPYLLDRIPGALPLNASSWDAFLPAVVEASKQKRIVVYAQDGAGAEQVADRLRRELHRDQIYVLRGGFDAWNAAMR